MRIAHIAAALGASVPEDFYYVTRDKVPTDISQYDLIADIKGNLDMLVDEGCMRRMF